MHRFFVPPETVQTDPVRLGGEQAHQIARVLRLSPGDEVALLDNSGLCYRARLLAVSPREVRAELLSRHEPDTEPAVRLLLYQAVPRGKKIEWALQKGTELGVSAFVPVISERCQGLSPADIDAGKLARWRRIVTEAAEQSGRAILPRVAEALPFAQAVQAARQADLPLIGAAEGPAEPLRAILESLERKPAEVALLIGPEGGFTPAEVSQARDAGVLPISLGPRVLRTETAPLVAFAAILYALEELG